MAGSPKKRFSIPGAVLLIPAYNESEVIAEVLAQIFHNSDLEVIVIDDASTDDTAELARSAGAMVIPLPVQLGAWGAVQTGMRYAIRHNYHTVISMDADGQHEAASLRDLVRPVAEGVADVSIGACTRRGSMSRHIAWTLMKRTSGLSLEDITSGFRVYNLDAIKILASWRATLLDYQDIGVLLLLQSHGLKIVDVEVNMHPRSNGPSKIFHSWLMVAYYMCSTLLLGVTKRKLARQYRTPQTIH